MVGTLDLMGQGFHHLQAPVVDTVNLVIKKSHPVIGIKGDRNHPQIGHFLLHKSFALIVPGVEITGDDHRSFMNSDNMLQGSDLTLNGVNVDGVVDDMDIDHQQ